MTSADSKSPDGEFSTRPVSADETVNGLRIALINIGILITIPMLVTGSKLGLALGFADFATAIVVAVAVLCVLGCLIAVIAAETRLSTYVIIIIQFTFGRRPPIAYGTFAVWPVAIAIAYGTDSGLFRLTFVPACDAVPVALVLHLVIALWRRRTE